MGTTRRANPLSARAPVSDVNALLRSTFANLGKMKSATVDAKVRIEPRGANAGAGTVAARLSGPFASQGANKLPKFAFKVELTSAGRTVAGGATYNGSKAFITLQGTAVRGLRPRAAPVRRRLRAVAQEPAEAPRAGWSWARSASTSAAG